MWSNVPIRPAMSRIPLRRNCLTRVTCSAWRPLYNAERNPNNQPGRPLLHCPKTHRHPDGKVLAIIGESPNAARRRWQHELSAKSFHSAIFDSARNHSQVTARQSPSGAGRHPVIRSFTRICAQSAELAIEKAGQTETNLVQPASDGGIL